MFAAVDSEGDVDIAHAVRLPPAAQEKLERVGCLRHAAPLSGRARSKVPADQLRQITQLLLERVARRVHAQRAELEVSDEAGDYLANAGYDPQYGARPLRRAIQRLLEDPLSERTGTARPGRRV